MKHLQDYINEAVEIKEAATSKSVTFDFKDLENGEETIKSLEGQEGVTIEDNKVTVEITADNVDKLDTVQDILQQFCQTIRSSQKRSSDEQYAQKTVSFEKKVGEMNDAIDEINSSDEEDNKKTEEDDKKTEEDDKKE